LLAQGQTQVSTLQQHTNKTLTIGPFGNTCQSDEVSPEVEAGVVAGIRLLSPKIAPSSFVILGDRKYLKILFEIFSRLI
jgi:hypothetical protein